jgi:hypothetical protein
MKDKPMELILIIVLLVVLFGGGFGFAAAITVKADPLGSAAYSG